MQKAGEEPLSACPRCGQPVAPQLATAINTPRITKPVSPSDARAAGFTVLKKVSRGEYEKH
jgi:hypothetical protein